MTENIPTDSTIFSMVRGHVESKARWFHSRRYMHYAGGASAVTVLAGTGIVLCCLGASTLQDKSSAAREIAASLRACPGT
jgi:hypothetical protein